MGTENLWDLVTLATGTDVMMLSPNYRNGIVHSSHLTKFKAVSLSCEGKLFSKLFKCEPGSGSQRFFLN